MADFAKKLAAGLVSVPSRMSWWPRHSRMMCRYLLSGKKMVYSLETERQIIEMSCKEWEATIPESARKGLMGHHTTLEMTLVDAVKKGKPERVDKIGSLLIENAEEMAASFGRCVVEFPEGRFHYLLGEHVASYVEIVRLSTEGSVKKAGDRMDSNILSLAAFTAEWF